MRIRAGAAASMRRRFLRCAASAVAQFALQCTHFLYTTHLFNDKINRKTASVEICYNVCNT